MTAETIHQCPPTGGVVMPCCGKTAFEVPRTDRMAADSDLVTCRDAKEADVPTEHLSGESIWADFLNMPIRFWVCPVDEHRRRQGVVTVEWEGDVAHCTWPGCNRTSADEREVDE